MPCFENLALFLTQWNLILEESPTPTKTGWIAKVIQQGRPCMLKFSKHSAEIRALRQYNGQGAVCAIEATQDVVLLERAIPGTLLSELVRQGKDEEACHIWCDVVEKLHSQSEIKEIFPSIESLAKDFKTLPPSLPRDLIEEARGGMDTLLKSQTKPILLHGDLHHDNIVYDEKRGWLAIDPQGNRGEAEYEVGAFFRNPREYPEICLNLAIIERRLDILGERLGFDRGRMIDWSFCQAVLAAIWSVEDGEKPEWAMDAAMAFRKIRL